MSIVKITTNNRFELEVNDFVAFIAFDKIEPNILDLVHTEVPNDLAGKGIGSKLVFGALQYCKINILKVIPSCPFIKNYIEKHLDWMELVSIQ